MADVSPVALNLVYLVVLVWLVTWLLATLWHLMAMYDASRLVTRGHALFATSAKAAALFQAEPFVAHLRATDGAFAAAWNGEDVDAIAVLQRRFADVCQLVEDEAANFDGGIVAVSGCSWLVAFNAARPCAGRCAKALRFALAVRDAVEAQSKFRALRVTSGIANGEVLAGERGGRDGGGGRRRGAGERRSRAAAACVPLERAPQPCGLPRARREEIESTKEKHQYST